MNLIFDIGNVLIDFKPKPFLHTLFNDPLLEDKLNEIIFKSSEWVKLDMGTITQQEACARFCLREPQYAKYIIETMERLPEMLTPIIETIEVLPKIKASGHGLYYLSNYHKKLKLYIQEKYVFFSLFDGGVFSCDVHMVKPNLNIYQCFLDRYQLAPQECVFIDDTLENVRAAEIAGMSGVLFTGVQEVMKFF